MAMRNLKEVYIVNGFAILHFATAYFSALADIPDSRLLTLMTILMTLIICVRERVNLEMTCLNFVIVNVAGYYLGMEVLSDSARLLSLEMLSPLNQGISSFISTEILGWVLVGVFRLSGNAFKIESEDTHYWDTRLKVVVIVIAVIFGARLFLSTVVQHGLFADVDMYQVFHHFLENYILLLLLLAVNLFVEGMLMRSDMRQWQKVLCYMGLIILLSAGAAFFQAFGLPFHYTTAVSGMDIYRNAVVAVAVELAFFSIVYLLLSTIDARKRARLERTQAQQVLFQYQNLKQQVNPHFLFNSLNILDSLILSDRPEDASEYVHKLSGVYRYMLQNEGEKLVTLDREMEYAMMYVDLLKVRFPDGLEVKTDVKEEDRNKLVVPCSVQLLVENAVKHNSTVPSNPLVIEITSDGTSLAVRNNYLPKKSTLVSHGVGQKYISQQYSEWGAKVEVSQDESYYTVSLPLLSPSAKMKK